MDDDTRTSRTDYYKSLNFAGTVDWAVDLLRHTDDDGNPNDDDSGDEEWFPDDVGQLADCGATFNTIEDLDGAGDIPDACKARYSVMALLGSLKAGVKSYTDMM